MNLQSTPPLSLKKFWTLIFFTGIAFLNLLAIPSVNAEEQTNRWTRFRGEYGSGISIGQNLPDVLNKKHIEWTIDLPGLGHGAPIIWDDTLFITSAIDEGATRYLYCLDAQSGKERWQRELKMKASHKHRKNSWASSTPTTDGEKVYVAFSDGEQYTLFAYDFSGELLWQQNLGKFESSHGQGTSPVLFEDLVILANDQSGPSTVVAMNKETGEIVWKTDREHRRVSYATPIFVPAKNGSSLPQMLVSCGAMGVTSLNPRTGEMHWQTGVFSHRTVGSPVYGEGLVVQTCGGGGQGKYMLVIDPRASSDTENSYELLYERKRSLPYVPTPIILDGHLYLCNDGGVANCLDLKTGKKVWQKRINGNYTSSPICVDGKIYMLSEEGEIVVISASPEYKMWGRLKLNDPSHSTPAAANGRLYVRTFHKLFSIRR